ncbi:TetR/AcrR family transcriptional regulator [Timonella sp. A28]|uniref:TetR/AcrR family transcriptional regulator n=1 Tax=Timonella sp. A28 TaxID=3442640 RepID=UPI003EBDE3AC
MSESAKSSSGVTAPQHKTDNRPPQGSLRAARKAKTQSALIAHARRMTLNKGLNGFTLDELCTEVGISRRTFFNYFASKDDAILGITLESPYTDYKETFLQSRGTLPLVEAIRILLGDSFQSMMNEEFTPDVMHKIFLEQPTLLESLHKHAYSLISELTALITQREELPSPAGYAHTVAVAAHQLTMSTFMDAHAAHTEPESFTNCPP